MRSESEVRTDVRSAIIALGDAPLREGGLGLFRSLGYASRKTLQLDGTPDGFLAAIPDGDSLRDKVAAATAQWRRVEFLFQLTNDEIPSLAQGQRDLSYGSADFHSSIPESFVFLAIELADQEWTRGQLVAITREVNRVFPMPVVVLFRHSGTVSLAVIDRRPNKRDSSRDVVEGRVSIIKDVDCAKPHRAQVDTLCDIALSEVKVRGRGAPTNFRDLYDGWIEALSTQTLNKKFYEELANWFFWSVKEVTFPAAERAAAATSTEKLEDEARSTQNQIAVIRLLTRLIFVWFIKEKNLVPDALFEPSELKSLLAEDPTVTRENSAYYKAVLQNLFFATLNTEMSHSRGWRTKAASGGLDGQYLIHSAYRFKDAFRDPDRALQLFKQVPFLNGGLFECLDREISEADLERNAALADLATKEGSRQVIRIDGFSERSNNPLSVPNKIFFATDETVDLNVEYDTKGKTYRAAGLIEIFSRYKFTVEENTPVEEEVALDPELLGKVFENLLASYNSDTKTTARKKSGSFYTPREVVDFMVDEALVAHFERHLAKGSPAPTRRATAQVLDLGAGPGELDLPRASEAAPEQRGEDLGGRLRDLLSLTGSGNPFSSAETDTIIAAIDSLRALDPACGSGAFPMGLLQKLIHVLHRLDPDNARWKAQNRRPLEQRLAVAKSTPDPTRREVEITEAEAALAKLDHDFSDANKPDYARKLYLIDKCLFGVDLQPIAVQIAKLRFFISLVVSQKIDRDQDNANITALPNLETKLVAANSLIPIERSSQADLFRNPAIEAKEAELRGMNARYFSARTMKTKRARREDITRLRDELADLLKSDRGLPEGDARKMAAWDPFDQNASASFFDPEWMFGLSSKFDLVIGNPPYVRHEAIKEQKAELERHYGGKDARGNPQGAYASTADLFVYFIQRGIDLLNPGGVFAYITSNKWYRAKYGERLRGWVNRQARLRRIIDFGDAEVFDAIAYPTIIVATRRESPVQVPADGEALRVLNWPEDRDRAEVEGFPALIDSLGFDMPQKTLTNDGWQLEPLAKRGLLERIRAVGVPLGQYVEGHFYYGIKTGFNDAFVVDGPTKDRLIAEDKSSAEVLKPFLRGRDVKRWRVEPHDLWLIKIESSENRVHPWSGLPVAEAEDVFATRFPAIHSFMTGYRDQLVKRHDQGRYFWELRSCSYWQEFERPKIILPAIQNKVDYASDTAGFYSNDKTSIIVDDRWPYLLAVLNSPVSWWLTQQSFASRQGGFYEFKPMYVAQVPIPLATDRESSLIEGAVRAVVLGANDGRLEQLVNGLVYELFFETDLDAKGLALFDEAERSGLARLAELGGPSLLNAAADYCDHALAHGSRLRTMLSDLQTLDIVRMVEGRE